MAFWRRAYWLSLPEQIPLVHATDVRIVLAAQLASMELQAGGSHQFYWNCWNGRPSELLCKADNDIDLIELPRVTLLSGCVPSRAP